VLLEAAAMRNKNCKGEEHNELPTYFLGGRSSLSSPHQSSPTQLHCIKTLNTSNHKNRRSFQTTVQKHLPQQEIQRTGLSVQAPSSTNNDTLKIITVVQLIITELNEAESETDKIMVITKMILNKTKWLLEFIGCSKS
jgi:hypothetical protein